MIMIASGFDLGYRDARFAEIRCQSQQITLPTTTQLTELRLGRIDEEGKAN